MTEIKPEGLETQEPSTQTPPAPVSSEVENLRKMLADKDKELAQAQYSLEEAKNKKDEKVTEVVLTTIETLKKSEEESVRTDTINNELSKIENEGDREKVRNALDIVNEKDPIKKVEFAKIIALGKDTADLAKKAIENRGQTVSMGYDNIPGVNKNMTPGTTPNPNSKYRPETISFVEALLPKINQNLSGSLRLKDPKAALERIKGNQ